MMFNINDNRRYAMLFDPKRERDFLINGSWEIVDDKQNFSLLLDNSKPAWVNLLLTAKRPTDDQTGQNLTVRICVQSYGSDTNPIRMIGEKFQINYVSSSANKLTGDTVEYEISLKIPPESLMAGMHYLYPQIQAESDGEDLGIVCKGRHVAVQVLDITY
ncbi:MAG: hypothetical protein AAF902_15645 [Chloroflexota bacterium]